MLSIKKTGEGYYLAAIASGIQELDRNSCYTIKKELSEIVKPHREISFDIKGVKSINSNGLKILQEFMDIVATKKCKVRFINVDPAISGSISILSGKTAKTTKSIEME